MRTRGETRYGQGARTCGDGACRLLEVPGATASRSTDLRALRSDAADGAYAGRRGTESARGPVSRRHGELARGHADTRPRLRPRRRAVRPGARATVVWD